MQSTALPVAGQAPAAATDAVRVLAAPSDSSSGWSIKAIFWSYSAAPSTGKLTISWVDGGTTYTETYYITTGGLNSLVWPEARSFPPGSAVTITLAAGGAGIFGTFYIVGQTD
jgi:hypothetical protein